MGVVLQEKFIVFKATQQGPQPVMIEDTEELAIMFINDAQARTNQRGGWSYAACPQRVRQANRVVAGQMLGYKVAKINDPNIRG